MKKFIFFFFFLKNVFFTWGFIWGSCAEYWDTHSPTTTRSNIFKRAKGKKSTRRRKKSLKNLNFSRNIQKKKAPAGEKYIDKKENGYRGRWRRIFFSKRGKRKKKRTSPLYAFRHWIDALLLRICIDGEVEGWCSLRVGTLFPPPPTYYLPSNYPTHHLVPFLKNFLIFKFIIRFRVFCFRGDWFIKTRRIPKSIRFV